jgi:hypothetical protein
VILGSAAANGTPIALPSDTPESKWLTLLDFDPGVVAFTTQPLEFDGVDGQGARCHVPDVFARPGHASLSWPRGNRAGWVHNSSEPDPASRRVGPSSGYRASTRRSGAIQRRGW